MLKINNILIYLSCCIIILFFLFYSGDWYHIENLMAHKNSITFIKEKGLNIHSYLEIGIRGEYFDNNPSRFRPISHFFEFIDHFMNGPLIKIFGIHFIFNTPSNILFITLSILILTKLFINKKNTFFLLIILIFISSCFYLSNIYFLLRPGKKLAILVSLILLYFLDHDTLKKKYKIYLFNFLLFIGLLCDEEFLVFFPFFIVVFHYKMGRYLNKNQIIESLYINFITILIYIYFIFFHNQNAYFNGKYYYEGLAQSLLSGIEIKLFFVYFFTLSKNFSHMIFGFNSIIIGIVIVLFLFFIENKYSKNFIFFKFEKILFFLFMILSYLIFNTFLELIGGNIILRSMGYYYGSTKIIIFFLILYLFKYELNNFFIEKIDTFIKDILIKIIGIIIIVFNFINFTYAHKLNNNMHYKNIDIIFFNENMSKLKRNESLHKDWDAIYNDDNHMVKNMILLKKLNINSEYNYDLIFGYGNMMPKIDVMKYEIFINKYIF